MKSCPPTEHWKQFLDDRLGQTDEAELSNHLESCPGCVHTLELLTAPLKDTPTDLGRTCEWASAPTPASRELQRLRQLLPATQGPTLAPAVGPIGLPVVPGFEIERELGRGGMGVVYLAKQTQLNRRVALKMVLASQYTTQEQIIRFLAEAQTCRGLTHPNIVQIFEVSQYGGVPFYAMEYVEGGTLADRVRQQPFTPGEAAQVVEDLAHAMHFAHSRGIIHRDLKPANILVASGQWLVVSEKREASSQLATNHQPLATTLKITDFGLAKRFNRDDGLTQAGALLGTPDYMAPEQVEPGTAPVGPGVDIYALGAILYYLITGRPPFTAATALQTLANVRQADAVSPSHINQAVPRDLSIICLHCLEKDPARRYASAEALADDLRRFLNGEPIAARPVKELERLWKWAKRRPAIASMSALLGAVVLTSLVLVSWQWYVASEARGRETERANNEAKAKRDEAAARREAQVLSSGFALDQGIVKCQAGQLEMGLELMIRALEMLPEDEPDLEFAIRTNISAWRERLCPAQRGPGQGTAVVSIVFSPDGKSALVGNWGNLLGNQTPAQAQLWQVDRWDQPPLWTVEHPGPVWSVAFDPSGENVAVGGFDGTTCVLDAKTGGRRFRPLPHPGRVYSVAFSPDGKTLAVGGHALHPKKAADGKDVITGGGSLRFWDAATGQALGEPVALPFRIAGVAWHPDGKSLALGGLDPDKVGTGAAGVAVVVDFAGRKIREPVMPHGDAVSSVAISPDGALLATGCRDGLVRFWSLATGKLQPKTLQHSDPVNHVAFNKSGKSLATASGHHEPGVRSGTGEIRVWDVATCSLLSAPPFFRIPSNSQKMHSVAFGDDDRKLVAACEHGVAWLWTLPPPLTPQFTFPLKDAADIVHSDDGRTMLLTVLPPRILGFGKLPCEIHIIDTSDGRTIGVLPHAALAHAHFDPAGKRFITYPRNSEAGPGALLWDAATGQRLPLPPDFGKSLSLVRFTADGESVVTITADGAYRRWDASSWKPLGDARPCLSPHEYIVAVDAACRRLVASSRDGTRLVDLPECRTIAPLHPERTEHGGFSVGDSMVVTVRSSPAPQVQRWNAEDGRPWETAVNVKDRFVITQNQRYLVDLVHEATTRDRDDPLEKGNATKIAVNGRIALHPTGQFIVGDDDGTGRSVQLWSRVGKSIGPPLPHSLVLSVAFNPNGRWLVTSSNDSTTKMWPLPTPAEGTPSRLRASLERSKRAG